MKLVITKALEARLRKIKDCPIAKQLLEFPEVEGLNYLGIGADNSISYYSDINLNRYGTGFRWKSKYRSFSRPGRVVNSILSNCLNRDLETFTNNYILSGLKKSEENISIVFGEDVRKYYLVDNYADYTGDLGNSCMRHPGCQEFFDIYTENPNHVRMAIMLNNDKKLEARCLIWYPETVKKKPVYFDRIYAINNSCELKLYKWCKSQDFIHISDRNIIKPKSWPNITIKLPNTEFDYYPYLDSIKYWTSEGLNNIGDGICLDSTDGERGDECECYNCGVSTRDIERSVAGRRESYLFCECCREFSEHYEGYIASSEAIFCDYTDDWYLCSDMVDLYDGTECYEDYINLRKSDNGDYFISGDNNFIQPEGCSEWYHKDDNDIEEINGTYYLIDSKEYNNLQV